MTGFWWSIGYFFLGVLYLWEYTDGHDTFHIVMAPVWFFIAWLLATYVDPDKLP